MWTKRHPLTLYLPWGQGHKVPMRPCMSLLISALGTAISGDRGVNGSPFVWQGFQLGVLNVTHWSIAVPPLPPTPTPGPRRWGCSQLSPQWPFIRCTHPVSQGPACPQEGNCAAASVPRFPLEGVQVGPCLLLWLLGGEEQEGSPSLHGQQHMV